MPELPEVEIFKQFFDNSAINHKIEEVDIVDKNAISMAAATFVKSVKGKTFIGSRRIGFNILAALDSGYWVYIDFGKTGAITTYTEKEEQPKDAKVIFNFPEGNNFAFTCEGRIGYMGIVKGIADFSFEYSIGPDVADLTKEEFIDIMMKKRGKIKTALMDQSAMAGIGNKYSDEILFHAKIHPDKQVNKLDEEQLGDLFNTMRKVLQISIRKGGEDGKLPRTFLIPNRIEGAACPVCKSKIKVKTIAGKKSFYCWKCQGKTP